MEWALNSVTLCSITFFFFLLLLLRRRQGLPPGPRGWPVFGYIFNLGSMPHISLNALKKHYGPVIWLKLGSKGTLVIQNSKAATELFRNHDLYFADRSITEVMRAHDYYKSSMALAPYGKYWRVLKRIVTVEMLVTKRLNESASVREKCVADMLTWIEKEAKKRSGVHVMHFSFLCAFNIIGNLLFSRDLVDPQSRLGSHMYKTTTELMVISGAPNISDFLPFLGWFDLQQLRKRMDRVLGKVIDICSIYVEERLKERSEEGRREKRTDYLEVLLDYEGNGLDEPAKLSKHDICVIMLDIIFGGTETTSSTVEWGLTELLRRPEEMIKVKTELVKVVGADKRLDESHINNLPYLEAVIKETLRLHPPLPFLIPRNSLSENTNFMGYKIPRNTQVFVNAWAIGRDPECWDEPLSFKPERFLGLGSLKNGHDFKGQHFEMVPFGGGRRNCPGIPLAQRTLPLMMGSMIHEFEWELEGNVNGETMDMREKMGITMSKLVPLKAIPKKNCSMI